MTISMSSASLPVFKAMLGNLSHILDKGQAHAEAKKFDPVALLQFRMPRTMLSFTLQILIACDGPEEWHGPYLGRGSAQFEDTKRRFGAEGSHPENRGLPQ
jgi:hypothetical protein